MYKIMLVDDEQPALHRLRQLIESYTDLQVSAMYTRPSEALEAASREPFHAAFLDIDMPGMDGLQLAAILTETYPDMEVVMVTAYSDFALQAFRSNVIDYLLKPVDPDQLIQCVNKLKRRLSRVLGQPLPPAADEGRIVGLGGFEAYAPREKSALRFQTAKAEELFAFMLIHPGIDVDKWTLCEQLWPGYEPAKAEQSLHTCVYRLKKKLAETGFPGHWISQRGSYRMTLGEGVDCDWTGFEQMVDRAAAQQTSPEDRPESSGPALEKAVARYRGALFQGKDYPWCEPLRERLERKFITAAKQLARLYAHTGKEGSALELLHRLTVDFPYDERAYEQLLELYVRRNDRTAFLLYYGKMETVLREGLGVEPAKSIRDLYHRMTGTD